MSLNVNRRAIITGASFSKCKATALAFAKAGIDVALVSRFKEKLETVARLAREAGVQARVYLIDLAQISQVRERMRAIAAEFGPIEILVNSAGIGYIAPLKDTPRADWQRVIEINLTSVFECIQAFLPSMRDRGGGTILNIISIAAKEILPKCSAYSANKFGLMALTKTLGTEERANGIRVVAIYPGAVNTPLWDAETVKADFDRNAMLTPGIVAESIFHVAQMPNIGAIEELVIMPSAGIL